MRLARDPPQVCALSPPLQSQTALSSVSATGAKFPLDLCSSLATPSDAGEAGRCWRFGITPIGPAVGAFDALHLSSAEFGDANVLLTTDDRFIKRAARGVGSPRVRVVNPVTWVRESAV